MKNFFRELNDCAASMFTINRQGVAILIFLPIIYTLLFAGLFYKNSLTNIPMIICNLDDGSAGRSLVEDFINTPELKVISVEGDALDDEKFLREDTAAGVVIIPKDFSNKIARGENVSVELVANYSSSVIGGTVVRAVQSVVATKNFEVLINRRIAAGWNETQAVAQLSASTRILFNPTGGYTDFFLAALILHGGQIAMVFVLEPSLAIRKKYRGENLFRNPVRCLGAKIFLYTLFESAVMAICLAIGIKFFGMICRGNPSEILILVAAYVACVTAFGLMMGAVAREPHQAIMWSLFYVMPSVLFAGAIWPRTSMDNISLFLSYVMPIGYAANDLRNLLVKGTAAGVEVHIAALLLMSAIFFAAAVGVLKFKGAKVFANDNAQGIQPADT